jgi:hypothetical protein
VCVCVCLQFVYMCMSVCMCMSVHVCASLPMPILWLKAPIAVPVTLTGRGEGKKKYTSTRRIWRIWRVWRICAGISNTLATCCVGIRNTLAATRRIRSRLCWKALAEVSESFPDATEGKTMFFLSSPKILTISPPPLGWVRGGVDVSLTSWPRNYSQEHKYAVPS